jgi:hypothetical protein
MPIIKRQLQRGLKSHLALNEARMKLRQTQDPGEDILQNLFQNKSQNLRQYRNATTHIVETKLKNYLNAGSLTIIEEENHTHYNSMNSAASA